jgi:hypothetical protein
MNERTSSWIEEAGGMKTALGARVGEPAPAAAGGGQHRAVGRA